MHRSVAQRRWIVSLAAVSVLVVAPGTAEHAVAAPAAAPTSGAGTPAATGTAGTFTPVGPTRVLDTRRGLGGSRPGPDGTVHLAVTGHAGVPASGVTAVVLTVTATAPTASGYVTVYADGTSRPTASSLNFRPGHTVAAQVYTPVGATGAVALHNGSAGSTQVVADVAGYFVAAPSRPGGAFVSTTPTRVLDSRVKLGGSTPGGGATVHLPVLGAGPVPTSGVSAVAITVTATASSAPGYVSAYADGTARPSTSTLNFGRGTTVANLAVVPVGPDGKIALYNGSAGGTPLVGDVVGYYLSGEAGTPGTYSPVTPTRLADGQAQPHGSVGIAWSGSPLPHDGVGEIVLNATVTQAAAGGYLTVTANTARPSTSSLNFAAGQTVADLAVVRYGTGAGHLYNGSPGRVRAIGDVLGYYVAAPGFGAITGTVRDAASNAGVRGVHVHAYLGVDNDDGTEAGSTVTGADGTYRLDRLPPSTPYVVCFDARGVTAAGDPYAGYPNQCYENRPWGTSGLVVPSDATQLSTTAGAVITGVDASLHKAATGTLAGAVTGTGGAGVAGVTLDVSHPDYGTGVTTAADGSYRIPALSPGTYDVCVETGAVTDANGPYGYVEPPCHHGVTITAGATTTVDEQLVAAGAVSGTITTTSGAAIRFGSAVVLDPAGNQVGGGAIGSGGAYTVTGVPPGTYRLCSASDPNLNPPYGLVDACVAGVVVRAGRLTNKVSEVVVPAGAISGTVRTQHGGPLYGAVVYLFGPDGTVRDHQTSGYDGTYEFSDLPPTDTGYAVCVDGSHAGDPPSDLFDSVCYPDEPWTPPTGTVVPPPTGETRVAVRSGALASGIDVVLTY